MSERLDLNNYPNRSAIHKADLPLRPEAQHALHTTAQDIQDVIKRLEENTGDYWYPFDSKSRAGKIFTGWITRNDSPGAGSDFLKIAYRDHGQQILYWVSAVFTRRGVRDLPLEAMSGQNNVTHDYTLLVNKENGKVLSANYNLIFDSRQENDASALEETTLTKEDKDELKSITNGSLAFTETHLAELNNLITDAYALL